jgi:hypothetical protein
VYQRDATGEAYADAVGRVFTGLGGCVAADVSFAAQLDMTAQAMDVLDSSAECGLLVAFAEPAIEFLDRFQQLGSEAGRDVRDFLWIGTTSLHTDALLEANRLHPRRPADALYGADEDTTPNTSEYLALRTRYNRHFGRPEAADMPIFASNAYDAMILAALAIEVAGDTLYAEARRCEDAEGAGIESEEAGCPPPTPDQPPRSTDSSPPASSRRSGPCHRRRRRSQGFSARRGPADPPPSHRRDTSG